MLNIPCWSSSFGLNITSNGTDFSFARLSKRRYLITNACTTDNNPRVAFLTEVKPKG